MNRGSEHLITYILCITRQNPRQNLHTRGIEKPIIEHAIQSNYMNLKVPMHIVNENNMRVCKC